MEEPTALKEILPASPQIHRVESSILGNTPEVQTMRENMRHMNNVLFAYELVQNAIDYHAYNSSDPQDLPSVVYVMKDGSRVNYVDLKEGEKPIKIEIRNKIRAGAGLDPYDVVNIEHRTSGSDLTLGKHGRGGTIAATAALTDGHIGGIEYTSQANNYAWKGRALMGISDPAHQKEPRFTLQFEHVQGKVAETIIGINHPDDIILNEFKRLPLMFLPANPRYEKSSVASKEDMTGGDDGKIKNIFTIYVRGKDEGSTSTAFSKEELNVVVYDRNLDSIPKEARIEIVDDRLIGRESKEEKLTDCVFEGGLKLRDYGDKSLFNWSFYGFENCAYAYRVSRSQDSSYLSGRRENLIALALRHCESPDVFLKILKNCTSPSEELAVEAKIRADLYNYSDLPSKTADALKKAWKKHLEDQRLPEDVFVTADIDIERRLEEEGAKSVLVRSEAFAQAIKKVTGLKDAKDALGLFKNPEKTGEFVRYETKSSEEHLTKAISDCINAMSVGNGRLLKKDSHGLIIELLDKAYKDFSGNYGDSPNDLQSLIKNYLLAGGMCRLKIGGYLFEFNVATSPTARGKQTTIETKVGVLAENGRGKAVLQMIAQSANEKEVFDKFYERLMAETQGFRNEDGTVNWEQYLASKHPPDVQSLLKIIEEQKRNLADKLLGLPPTLGFSQKARKLLTRPNAVKAAILTGIFTSAIIFGPKAIDRLHVSNLPEPNNPFPSIGQSHELPSDSALKTIETHLKNTQKDSVKTVRPLERKNLLPDKFSAVPEKGMLEEVGYMINLPRKWFGDMHNGGVVGYFPENQFLNMDDTSLLVDNRILSDAPPNVGIFNYPKNTNLVDIVRQIRIKEDELVYSVDMTSQALYVPTGWRIRSLHQQGISRPPLFVNGGLGAFWQDIKEVPKKVIVVAEKIEEERLPNSVSPRIHSYKNKSPLGEYEPTLNLKEAMNLNARLEGDPELRSIHRDFIREMYGWTIGEVKDKKQATDIVLRYLDKFSRYSDKRTYSLIFQIDKKGTRYDTIVSIASRPNEGYFCSVASNVVAEFLKSVGIYASNQPGNNIYDVNGVMYKDLYHENNVVYGPDGTMLTIDTTPFLTDRTDSATANFFSQRHEINLPSSSEAEMANLLRKNVNFDVAGGDVSITDKAKIFEVLKDKQITDTNELRNTLKNVGIGVDLVFGNAALLYFVTRFLLRRRAK